MPPSGSPLPAQSSKLLEQFRSSKKHPPLHPLEKAVLTAVALHLCFLPWALGTMHVWSQITSLVLAAIGFGLALIPRTYAGDYAIPVSPQVSGLRSQVSGYAPSFRLTMWPRLLHFPIFWIGLALLGYIALQASNPSWVWERSETQWWLRRVNDIPWLPTSVDTPFERFDAWRQFIIYASAWLTVCTVWTGFTRRRSLQLLLMTLVLNAMVLSGVGFFQKFAGLDSYLFMMKWPVDSVPFASFIYHNHAGSYFALISILSVSLAMWIFAQGERTRKKSTPSGVMFFCALLLTTAVFFSLSRGASILITLGWLALAVWFWLRLRRDPNTSATSPAVYTAVVVVFVVVVGFSVRNLDFSFIAFRFNSLIRNYQSSDESVQSRIQAHLAADSMLTDHWLRGVGAGGFRYLFPEYIKLYPEVYAGGKLFWEHAHCDWREIPIELGAVGTLLLLLGGGYWLLFFYRSRAVWHSLVVPVLIGCSQTLTHAWFDFPFQCPAILITWLSLIVLSARWIELDAN
jgi:hypothetical protein